MRVVCLEYNRNEFEYAIVSFLQRLINMCIGVDELEHPVSYVMVEEHV